MTMKKYIAIFLIYSLFFFFLSLDSLYALGVVPFHCLFKFITGYPCPFCGGIRAVVSMVTLHPLEAFQWNPLAACLFLIVIFSLPLAVLYFTTIRSLVPFKSKNIINSSCSPRPHNPLFSFIPFKKMTSSYPYLMRSLVAALCVFTALNWLWLIFLSPCTY